MQEEQTRFSGMLYLLMIVVALAFGGFVWQLYSAPTPPHIAAPAEPYKIAPPPEALSVPEDAAETADDETTTPSTQSATAATASSAPAVPQLSAAPTFASDGPFVAQLAALQSEDGIQPAWRRLSSRAPGLFGAAHLDVERADLGQRGVYFRVRAGYFADRANATRFCDRIRQMGQDCIPVAR